MPEFKEKFDDKVIDLARVTRVVAGGKRFRFRATIIIGNRQGKVGVGVAKGLDVAQAIEKARKDAQKKLIEVPIQKNTIPHQIEAKYGSSLVFLKSAPEGRGIIAGGPVRIIFDLAGVKNVIGKVFSRSGNKINISRATIKALTMLKSSRGSGSARPSDSLKEGGAGRGNLGSHPG